MAGMQSTLRHTATLLLALVLFGCNAVGEDRLPELTVYKSPYCGCCSKWVDHMRLNGFSVISKDVEDLTPIKTQQRVPVAMGSCHTAIVGSYTIEGHVPADAVKRLLRERPAGVIGLTVPGMPQGSPGMESLTPERYEILSFDAAGQTRVYDRR